MSWSHSSFSEIYGVLQMLHLLSYKLSKNPTPIFAYFD